MREHHYAVSTTWTGNRGSGTSSYRAYARDHEVAFAPEVEPTVVQPASWRSCIWAAKFSGVNVYWLEL